MEIQDPVLRPGVKNQEKKRPATCYDDRSPVIEDYKTDLRKSLQAEQNMWKLAAVGDIKYDLNRRMSLQLEKQLQEMSALSGTNPATVGNQTAMISCWNSVHGKPDIDKVSESPKETDSTKAIQTAKKPLGRTTSDEIRTALKQKHAQSMERALRRNSGAFVSANTQNKMGARSMSMIAASVNTSGPGMSRSMSAVASNSSLNAAFSTDTVEDDRSSLNCGNNNSCEKVNKIFDENSNEKPDFMKESDNVCDEVVTARQSSYPGAFQRLSVDDKRFSLPLSDTQQKHVRFTIEPADDGREEVTEQSFYYLIYNVFFNC